MLKGYLTNFLLHMAKLLLRNIDKEMTKLHIIVSKKLFTLVVKLIADKLHVSETG
jgi:hypothetical protein